ncbi:MAG: hypothetical protein RLY86_1584 [Pseudomonadota bacterium]
MRDLWERAGRSWLGYYGTGMVVLVLVFTSLDPSPSAGLGVLDRIVFWMAHIGAGLLILILCQSGLSRTRLFRGRPAWVRVVVAGALGALAFTPVALGLDHVFPDLDGEEPREGPGVLTALALEFANLVIPFTGSWLLLNAPKLMQTAASPAAEVDGPPLPAPNPTSIPDALSVQRPAVADPSPPATTGEGAADTVLDRIPPRLGREIVALSAELHYLRVHTTRGETLILYSFGQAVEDLTASAVAGMRVHRSHWIALDRVTGLEKQGEKLICVVQGPLRFPVSRPYRPALRAALKSRLD